MENLDYNLLKTHHKKILNVNNEPYGHCSTKDFFPENIIKSVSSSFRFPDTVGSTSDPLFQKTKRSLNDYNLFPQEIKKTIDYLNSRSFIDILEEKFNIKNLLPDPSLFGGGMHESRNGGYLKIHSDFVYIRNKKLKRMTFILINMFSKYYLNFVLSKIAVATLPYTPGDPRSFFTLSNFGNILFRSSDSRFRRGNNSFANVDEFISLCKHSATTESFAIKFTIAVYFIFVIAFAIIQDIGFNL